MTTTGVGKGHRDDKGFREALTMLAAGAGCRDQGASTMFFARRQRVGEEERPRERRSRDLYVICKIRLDPFFQYN